MRQKQETLFLKTKGKSFTEVTGDITSWVEKQGIEIGLLTLFVKHTSASLIVQENADPDVLRDLESFFSRLVPEKSELYRHTIEGKDDMPAHIRSALTLTQVSIPVSGNGLMLGTWQGIYLYEHRDLPHNRQILMHLLGE